MKPNLVKIEIDAFSDLIYALQLLTKLLANKSLLPSEEENKKLDYINKLIINATKSYNKHNL